MQAFEDIELQEEYFKASLLSQFLVIYTLSYVMPPAVNVTNPAERRFFLKGMGDADVQFKYMTTHAWLSDSAGEFIGGSTTFIAPGLQTGSVSDRGISMAIYGKDSKAFQQTQGVQFRPGNQINTVRDNNFVPLELWAGPAYGQSFDEPTPFEAYLGRSDAFEFRCRNADALGYHRLEINLLGERYV